MSVEPKRIHSRKVPDSYKIAAKICREVSINHCNVKDLIFSGKYRHVPLNSLYGMVAKTLQNGKQIDSILKQTHLLSKEPKLDPWLAKVLIAQLLSGRELAAKCKPIETILKYADEIKNALGDEDFVNRKPKDKLIYARVNILLTTVEHEVNMFEEDGWKFIPRAEDYETHLERIKSELLSDNQHYVFLQDFHIPELFVFSPSSKIQGYSSVKNGHILLQDKASCLAAMLLQPEPNSIVLDMCAGPGMKTSYLAALMNNEGTLYAVERDSKRFETMNERLDVAGATCVQPVLMSALDVTSEECPSVQYILLDPPCSGSGMLDRSIYKDSKEEAASKDRLEKLHNLQAALLRHSLTSFPQANRVVYSTCSVNSEENEHVVEDVLRNTGNFKLINATSLINGTFGNGVQQVGIKSKCICTRSDVDYTNGFFIAVFERTGKEKVKNKKKGSIRNDAEEINVPMDNENYGAQCKRKECRTTEMKQFEMQSEGKELQEENVNYVTHEKHVKKKKRKHKYVEPERDNNISDDIIKSIKKKKRKKSVTDDD